MDLFYSSENLLKQLCVETEMQRNKQILRSLWQLVAFSLRYFLSSLPFPDCQIKLIIKIFHTALLRLDTSKAPLLSLLPAK